MPQQQQPDLDSHEIWEKDLFDQLGDLFDAAIDLPLEEQRAFLDKACAGNPELRRELDLMLAGSGSSIIASTVEEAAARLTHHDLPDPLINTWLGPYRVTALIGRGGMGAVYRAVREDDQYRKDVAIKVIPKVLAGPEAIVRFRSERQILAHLEHQNIARLIDGGTSEGIPFLVMEYIDGGVPVTRYANENVLPLEDRLKLIQSVCHAVQYAHSNLVVHRDLKPANILVAADGTVKLLDFGVAKILDPSAADTSHTATMLMTPDYASPEQIRGEPATTSTDIYSLGIVMYEVLTGEKPYRITGTSPAELERAICQTDPRPPSGVPLLTRRMQRSLEGDVDNIVLMALRKDVTRRYQSAQHLSDDIQRFLNGDPVHARADTIVYRSSKFLSRHRWSVAAGFAIATALLVSSVISIRQANAASNRFNQLRGFARSVLVDLHGELGDIPGTARARAALIAHVNEYLRGVVANDPDDDTALATEIATTYLRIGEMQGATQDALASFGNGRALLEQKRTRGSASASDVLLLARLRMRLGMAQADMGQTPQAVENLAAAAQLADPPYATVESAQIRAQSFWRLGRIYRIQYKLTDAQQFAQSAVDSIAALGARGAKDRELAAIQTGARLVLAGVLRRQGQWEQSLNAYLLALEETRKRAGEDPSSASLQRELAHTHQLAADILTRVQGRESEVRTNIRASIAIAEKLVAADPQDRQAQSELAQYLSTAAECMVSPEDWQEVAGYLRRSLALFQTLLEKEPRSGVLQLYAGLTEAELGNHLSLRNPDGASLRMIRQGLGRLQALADREPDDLTSRIEVLKINRVLMSNLALRKRNAEALRIAAEQVEVARHVGRDSGPSAEFPKRELPRAYAAQGKIMRMLGMEEEARQAYRQSLKAWDVWKELGQRMPDADAEIARAREGARPH